MATAPCPTSCSPRSSFRSSRLACGSCGAAHRLNHQNSRSSLMLKKSVRAFTGLALVLAAASANAAPPAGFAERVEQLRKAFGAPGVSIAIVEDGKVTLARGWGVKDITSNQ